MDHVALFLSLRARCRRIGYSYCLFATSNGWIMNGYWFRQQIPPQSDRKIRFEWTNRNATMISDDIIGGSRLPPRPPSPLASPRALSWVSCKSNQILSLLPWFLLKLMNDDRFIRSFDHSNMTESAAPSLQHMILPTPRWSSRLQFRSVRYRVLEKMIPICKWHAHFAHIMTIWESCTASSILLYWSRKSQYVSPAKFDSQLWLFWGIIRVFEKSRLSSVASS